VRGTRGRVGDLPAAGIWARTAGAAGATAVGGPVLFRNRRREIVFVRMTPPPLKSVRGVPRPDYTRPTSVPGRARWTEAEATRDGGRDAGARVRIPAAAQPRVCGG